MLLAWDSTNRVNWGARGAHLATYQILSQNHEEVEALPGRYHTWAEPVDFVLPEWISRRFRQRRDRFWLASAYVELESFFGASLDYVDPRPEVGVRRIQDNLDNEHIRGLYDRVDAHDTIVIDGNGDMIFKEEPTRNLLAGLTLIELAHALGKRVCYVNSIFADCSMTGRNESLARQCIESLKKCDEVAFRDPQSLTLAREMSDAIEAQLIPDTLFHWYDDLQDSRQHLPANGDFVIPFKREGDRHFGQLDFDTPYICVTGGSRAAFTPQKSFEGFCALVEQLHKLEHPVYLVPTCGGDRFLHDVAEETRTPIVPAEVPILMGGAILANARLFVTGRYHPSIMAAAGGTPCVFLGADSHKTRSLQRMLGYEEPYAFSAVPTPDEHADILARSRALMEKGGEVRDRIQRSAKGCAEEARQLAAIVNGS